MKTPEQIAREVKLDAMAYGVSTALEKLETNIKEALDQAQAAERERIIATAKQFCTGCDDPGEFHNLIIHLMVEEIREGEG